MSESGSFTTTCTAGGSWTAATSLSAAGATHALLDWLVGQRLSYSVGFGLPTYTADLLAKIPPKAWQVAYDSDGDIREGAWVTELTGLLDQTGWPKGMGHRAQGMPALRGAAARPTPTGCASRRSRPTPPAGSSPTSSYGTAAGPRRPILLESRSIAGLLAPVLGLGWSGARGPRDARPCTRTSATARRCGRRSWAASRSCGTPPSCTSGSAGDLADHAGCDRASARLDHPRAEPRGLRRTPGPPPAPQPASRPPPAQP